MSRNAIRAASLFGVTRLASVLPDSPAPVAVRVYVITNAGRYWRGDMFGWSIRRSDALEFGRFSDAAAERKIAKQGLPANRVSLELVEAVRS